MNDNQKEHFRGILKNWRSELMEEVDRTVSHMKDEAANFPDPGDRATQEEEFSLELRTRDRERKLIKKIESTLEQIDQDEYGYCDACGVEIGIKRLEARPTATLCIDCKTLEEIKEKQEARHRSRRHSRSDRPTPARSWPDGIPDLPGPLRPLAHRPAALRLAGRRACELPRRPRATAGTWLVRIEDLDPPREQRGATGRILQSLRAHALHWDETELYQRERTGAYERVVVALLDSGDAFHCTCSRQDLHLDNGAHAAACPRSRAAPAGESAIRLRARGTSYRFSDIFLGEVELPGPAGTDDFVIRRRDGLYAYQLAVVIDDAFQGITHVVRGRDLLESTPHQIFLRSRLGLAPVRYGHIPLAAERTGAEAQQAEPCSAAGRRARAA